ncbi:hypothetical protein ACFW6R_09025 [Streptomyces albidoflavus]
MAQFKAGDKVRWGDLTGVVRFGPYISELGNQDRYLVECAASGRCQVVSGSILSPALEIGDKVTVADLSGTFTLAAGPWTFPREPGGPQYIVTDAQGYAYVEAAALVHAAAPEADQPHAWRDRQGDIWYPLGEAEGEQRYGMEFGAEPDRDCPTLPDLRVSWGPLEGVRLISEPATEGATAKDASGDIWYRHGTGSDGVGRWSMARLGSAAVSLDRMSTWQGIVTNFGPMRAAQ